MHHFTHRLTEARVTPVPVVVVEVVAGLAKAEPAVPATVETVMPSVA